MELIRRGDAQAIEGYETTPSGGLRVPCRATRTGVLPYKLADGSTRREYRPPEEVFAPESLDSMRDAPVCVGHPPAGVTAENWRACAVGHVSEPGTPEGIFVRAPAVVQDAATVERVISREIGEVSMGYFAEYHPGAGTSPEGEEYDGTQRKIRYNHLSLLRPGEGRAGPDVRLLLDSFASDTLPEMKITVDGVEVVHGSPEHLAALEKLSAKTQTELAAAVARADSRITTEEARKLAHRRAALIAAGRVAFGPSYADAMDPAAEAKSDDTMLAEILKQVAPGADFNGKSPDYMWGFLAATMGATKPAEAPATDAAAPTPPGETPKAPPAAPPVARDACSEIREGGAVRADAADEMDPVGAAEKRAHERRLARGKSK